MTVVGDVGYFPLAMNGWQHKGSFVVWFSSESDPGIGLYCGRVEHVASSRTMRFQTLEELQRFLQNVLHDATIEFQEADTLAEELAMPVQRI